jgi:uncharacterized membrane protein
MSLPQRLGVHQGRSAMRTPTSLLAQATLSLSLLAAASSLGATTLYRITQIGALPGDDTSRALALNDLGQVVGSSGVTGQDTDPYRRQNCDHAHPACWHGINSSAAWPPMPTGNNIGSTASDGCRLPSGATARAGWTQTPTAAQQRASSRDQGRNQAVMWVALGQIASCRPPAALVHSRHQPGRRCQWRAGSSRWDPANPGHAGGFSYALGRGMIGLGQAAGFATNNFSNGIGSHAVLWASDGSVTDLGLSAHLSLSSAADVNDGGLVVGHAVQASNSQTVTACSTRKTRCGDVSIITGTSTGGADGPCSTACATPL